MLTYDDALNLNYYKKTTFTGWMGGMRFLIKMEKINEGTEEAPREVSRFHAWVWPGPYIYDLTPAEKKTDFTAPFSNDGKKVIVDWINEQYTTRTAEWPELKTDEV